MKLMLFLVLILFSGWSQQLISQENNTQPPPIITNDSQPCFDCHKEKNPGLVAQWKNSAHYNVKVGCYECHKASKDDVDSFLHSEPETYISIIVSPKDCSNCHEEEVKEFSLSSHSTANDLVVEPIGVLIGEFVFGNNDLKTHGFPDGVSATNVNACWKCHGSKVKLVKNDNQVNLDPATWPNTGIGRINPDGSKGNCSACHSGHEFSVVQARQPESCRACHSGDASLSEYEIYSQSLHGINYSTHKNKMNLDNAEWITGKDYYSAPTCASCHMTAAPGINATHNINTRIKTESDNMKQVCFACHTETVIENFYLQAKSEDALVIRKWMEPTTELYCLSTTLLKEISLLTETVLTTDVNKRQKGYYPFTNPIDYTYLFMSHDASVARVAAFMMSPQYVEDMNKELASYWFGTLVPQIRELITLGLKDPKTKKLSETLEERLNYWLSQPSYGNPKWPDASLTKCPKIDE
jgi:hydroxylamine dehydrogenase